MDDVKAIDVMNYPLQIKGTNYNFNNYEEWLYMARTTFRPFFPKGRFPVTDDELKEHKHLFGTVFFLRPT